MTSHSAVKAEEKKGKRGASLVKKVNAMHTEALLPKRGLSIALGREIENNCFLLLLLQALCFSFPLIKLLLISTHEPFFIIFFSCCFEEWG